MFDRLLKKILISICQYAILHWVDLWPNSETQKHFQTWHPPVRVLPHIKEYYKHGCHNVLNFAIRRFFSGYGLLTMRRNLYSWPQEVKEAAYKGLVRPVLDYGSSVWDPPGVVLQEELESVQRCAARFVTSNYNYETGSMTGILGQLKWESLKKRRKDNRLIILLYKGLKGKASVPTYDIIPKTRPCRNQHSMAFQTPIANTDVYKGSFFPQTIRDWNALPDSLISSREDAEDCVAKFTSLVRARD